MKITNWKGLAPQSTFDRHSDGFFTDRYRNLLGMGSDFTPAVNVRESPESYTIEVAAPGLKKDDFEITLIDGRLTIKCEKGADAEYSGDGYTYREFSTSAFSRSFGLPKEVDDEHVSANYENGILKINLPLEAKPEENEAVRRIPIA